MPISLLEVKILIFKQLLFKITLLLVINKFFKSGDVILLPHE